MNKTLLTVFPKQLDNMNIKKKIKKKIDINLKQKLQRKRQ